MSSSVSTEQLGLSGNDIIKFTGSQINYYFICKRKLWLFSHNIELEPESDLVKLGKLLHENRYKRRKMKEVQIDRIRVDFMEAKKTTRAEISTQTLEKDLVTEKSVPSSSLPMAQTSRYDEHLQQPKIGEFGSQFSAQPQKELIIHEVKRSNKMQDAHLYQLLYYVYSLKENHGVNIQRGVLHYPLLNQNVDVPLTQDRIRQIEEAIVGITKVNSQSKPPEPVWKGYCRSCAYRDLCWG